MVHPWPQTPQGESVAQPGTPLLLILNLIFKIDIKQVHVNMCNSFFEKKVYGQKHPEEADECRNNIPYITHFILSKYCQKCGTRQSVPRRGHWFSSVELKVGHQLSWRWGSIELYRPLTGVTCVLSIFLVESLFQAGYDISLHLVPFVG